MENNNNGNNNNNNNILFETKPIKRFASRKRLKRFNSEME